LTGWTTEDQATGGQNQKTRDRKRVRVHVWIGRCRRVDKYRVTKKPLPIGGGGVARLNGSLTSAADLLLNDESPVQRKQAPNKKEEATNAAVASSFNRASRSQPRSRS